MTSTNSVSGLSSGFDWQSMIDQLIEIDKAPVTLVENQKTKYEDQLSAWQSFNTTLLSLKTAAQNLSDPEDFNVFASSMTSDNTDVDAEDLLAVSTTSYASVGSYNITINNIATAQKLSSVTYSSSSDSLGTSYNGDIIINGKVITISETDGLDDIRNRINNASVGVTASIIRYSSTDYRLILTSKSTGSDGIILENGTSTDLVGLFGWKNNEIIAGQDASLTIDGVGITSSDNIIDDVLSGVTLKLTNDNASTTITVNIERDLSAIEEKIQSFVDAYNAVSSYISEQQTYDKEEETAGGILFGDGTLSSVKSDLSSLLVEPIWGVSSEFSILGMAGINLDDDGQLSIDRDKLNGLLETNFNDIQQLFCANGTSDSGSIEYIYSTNDTKAGEYAVNITQAATEIGLDVAGTINNEAATGSGQKLTGNKGEANIAGLVIKYTGSTTGNVGNIKLTVGVAELFDRALFNITDSYEGYVAFKRDSLTERISDLEERIDQMNARLDLKKEAMLVRFSAMELALSRLQSMSSWLTGQLEAASSGWK